MGDRKKHTFFIVAQMGDARYMCIMLRYLTKKKKKIIIHQFYTERKLFLYIILFEYNNYEPV
jgi:hypothetical protein